MLGNSVVSTGTGTQAAHGGKTSSKLHASTSHGDGQAAYATATEGYDYDEDEQHDDHEDHEDEENYACEDDDECYDDGQEDTEARNNEDDLQRYIDQIVYSTRYRDETNEYRHVILPRDYYANYVPADMKGRLLTEHEWRAIGITMSVGWWHYELHQPEPHIFLFKRDLPTE